MHKNLLLVFIIFSSLVPALLAKPLKIQLTETEKAFLQAHPVIRFGTDETWKPYISRDINGELQGLDVDFIRYINETTGANIQLVTGQWVEIVKKAKRHEIDGLATSSPLEARKPFFDFSQTYVSEFPIVVLPSESQLDIQKITDLSGKRIAFQEGNEFYVSLIQPHPTIKIVEAASELESIKIMLEGKADASLTSTSTYYSQQKHFLKSIKIGYVATEKELEVVYSVRKDWPELVSIIDKSLAAIPIETHDTIYKKWFRVDPPERSLRQPKDKINFTKGEKRWLKKHPVIRVANETDWPPFDFNESGIAKGLAIDHIQLLAQKIGVEIEFIYGYTWMELIELFQQKKIDVMPVLYITEERKKFTLYTKPYYKGKLGMFTHIDEQDWNINLLGKKVGMETSHGSIPLLKKKIPAIEIIEVEKKVDLVRKLATKQLDVIIGNPFVFHYLARENQIENIRLSDFINMTDEEQRQTSLHIGIREDWPMLHQILEKAMQNVSEEEMNHINNKWANITIIKKIDWVLVAQIFGVIILIISFLFWHNRKLKTMVELKTQELKELNIDLESQVAERTQQLSEKNKELAKKNETITEDLTLAESVQKRLFTEYTCPSYLKIATRFIPHSHVSGDIYKIYPYKNGTYNLFLGDSTGHGIAAALSTVMANVILLEDRHTSLTRIMEHINELFEQHLPHHQFMTAILVNINHEGKLRQIVAGHAPLILIPANGEDPILLERGGMVLGILPKSEYKVQETQYTMMPGDRGILYTDGITERENLEETMFGLKRLLLFLKENRTCDLDSLLSMLLEHVNSYAQGKETNDDITLVVFEYIQA